MSEPLSSVDATARLIEIRQREQGATKGPWSSSDVEHALLAHVFARFGQTESFWAGNTKADGEFIAHAREDIPYLLSSVDAVRVRVQPTISHHFVRRRPGEHPHCRRCHVPLHSAEAGWNDGRCDEATIEALDKEIERLDHTIRVEVEAHAEVRARVHQIEQERDELRKAAAEWRTKLAAVLVMHSEHATDDLHAAVHPPYSPSSELGGRNETESDREETTTRNPKSWIAWKRAAEVAEARVSHLEQELNTATKGQWTQAESDAVKWRAQERSETWAHTRLRTALEIWADAIFTIDGTIAADNEELVEAAYALRAAAFPSAIPGSYSPGVPE